MLMQDTQPADEPQMDRQGAQLFREFLEEACDAQRCEENISRELVDFKCALARLAQLSEGHCSPIPPVSQQCVAGLLVVVCLHITILHSSTV